MAFQGVPRSMQSAMPATMKFDHIGASTGNGNYDIQLDNTTSPSEADAFGLLMNSPYSPVFRHCQEGTNGAQRVTDSTNLAHVSEMAGLYNKGTVIHSEVRVDFANEGTRNQATGSGEDYHPVLVGITPIAKADWTDTSQFSTTAAPAANYAGLVERYGTVYAPLGAHGTKTLFNSIAPHKFLGKSDPLSEDDLAFTAADNAIPENYAVWAVWSCPMLDADAPAFPVHVCYAMRQTIVWHEPANPTRSNTT